MEIKPNLSKDIAKELGKIEIGKIENGTKMPVVVGYEHTMFYKDMRDMRTLDLLADHICIRENLDIQFDMIEGDHAIFIGEVYEYDDEQQTYKLRPLGKAKLIRKFIFDNQEYYCDISNINKYKKSNKGSSQDGIMLSEDYYTRKISSEGRIICSGGYQDLELYNSLEILLIKIREEHEQQ